MTDKFIEENFKRMKIDELNYVDNKLNELREPLLQKLLSDIANTNALNEKEHGYLNAIEDMIKIVRDRKDTVKAVGTGKDDN